MSPAGEVRGFRGEKDELPAFELDYGFDDPDDPGEVTIYAPDAETVTTSWISIEARRAVSLEDVA